MSQKLIEKKFPKLMRKYFPHWVIFAISLGLLVGYYTDGTNALKNHAITIGVATTAFAGTLAVLPAAVAPIVQIPIMMAVLKASGLIQRFLGFGEDSSRQSHSIAAQGQKKL